MAYENNNSGRVQGTPEELEQLKQDISQPLVLTAAAVNNAMRDAGRTVEAGAVGGATAATAAAIEYQVG